MMARAKKGTGKLYLTTNDVNGVHYSKFNWGCLMARIGRLKVRGEPAVYHLISRTTLQGFVLGDREKDYLLALIKRLSDFYFAEVLGFSLLGNHFHLLVRMHLENSYSDEEVRERCDRRYGEEKAAALDDARMHELRGKMGDVSEYVKEIKQSFSRHYNKLHQKKGYFWAERFKSVIVESGEALINCLAYIELNPVRAGLIKRPEDYRWCSLGYHVQTRNKGGFLSLDFGLQEFGLKSGRERLRHFRRFVYEKGRLEGLDKECKRDFEVRKVDRFLFRTRYFTDSGIIGSKAYVSDLYLAFKHQFSAKRGKVPKRIRGLEGIYSLKRLAEDFA
jgi:putative transposase